MPSTLCPEKRDLQICRIWIQLITACGNIAREGVGYKTRITPFSVAVLVRPHQWWVFWTHSLAIFPHIVISWIQIRRIWRPRIRWNVGLRTSLLIPGGMNSRVSFSNDATIARTRWAFQFLQGNVKTLFRWDEKHLHDFAANLFRKLRTKFHLNCMGFLWDITKNWSYFSGHTVVCKSSDFQVAWCRETELSRFTIVSFNTDHVK